MFGGHPFGEPYFGGAPELSEVPVIPPPVIPDTGGAGRPGRRRRIPRFEWRPSARKELERQEISGHGEAVRAAGQSHGVGTVSLVSGSGKATRARGGPLLGRGRNLAPIMASGHAIAPAAQSMARGRRMLDTRWEEEAVALLLLDD